MKGKTNEAIFIPIVIAFLILIVITKSIFISSLITATLAVLIFKYSDKAKPKNTNRRNNHTLDDDPDFLQILILLSASIIKADGRIYQKERDLVRERLAHDFNEIYVDKYMQDLEICLKKSIKIESVCNTVKYSFDNPSKIQIIHFLVGLTVTNSIMVDAEYALLKKIAFLIGLPRVSLASILAMFKYKRVSGYENNKSKNDSYSSSHSTNGLSRSYQILEIKPTATDAEVKKAYRRLAKIHHPDRVAHLGKEYQKSAKVKFQKIANAYEKIKDKRGF